MLFDYAQNKRVQGETSHLFLNFGLEKDAFQNFDYFLLYATNVSFIEVVWAQIGYET